MNCADAEILICDYVDGTLEAAGRRELERHLEGCSGCAELARDATAAVNFMDRAEEVEAPPELVTRILFDPPWAHARARAAAGLRSRFRGFWQPLLQPRFAMGMAMTILSFAMLARFVPIRQIQAKDLNPVAIWHSLDDQADRAWQRTVKFYESLRVVYQIQSTVREWQQEQEAASGQEPPARRDDSHRLPVKNPPAEPGDRK